MKIEIPRADLLPALNVVAGVVERRQTLPILGNLLIQAQDSGIALRATDMEVEIGTRARAEVHEPGEITVPSRKLMDICRSLPEGAVVTVRVEGERAVVSSGRSRFTLSTLPARDFPSMELGEAKLSLQIPSAAVKRLLDKTAFAMAQQDVRYYLNGVLLELREGMLRAVATDGHRLAKVSSIVEGVSPPGEDPMQMIIPAKTVLELKRLLAADDASIELELSERTVRVSFGENVLASKLIDGRYPDYERVIPKELPQAAKIDKETLRGALQRAAILSNEKYKGVRVSFDPGTLGLQSNNPEKEHAEDEIEIEYDGPPCVVGFNVSYVLDVLQVVQEASVEVRFRDGDSSAVWAGEGADNEEFVIMPMRL
ncbi:MAG: DNA polymerase III subunit beta [Thiohalocapsa sp.]|nr:DNA polymerase III subunit beta [Thiohalocapsa sp.]MCF7990237.1 DNA polymerase III subunit beta [Thiohalocapsa sp.]